MSNTFAYLMNAYFYQEWWTEYSDPKANDKEVLVRFVSNENMEILNSLVQDLKYILANDLEIIVSENNSFDCDPVLNGYVSEHA